MTWLLPRVRGPAVEGRSRPSWALGPDAAFLARGWASDPSPSRPKAVLKRLMGAEPSVMRVDFRPRLWSSFTWKEQEAGEKIVRPWSLLSSPRPPLQGGLPPALV